MNYVTLRIVFAVLLLCTLKVHASLMISPTRVVFDERQRHAKVFLINSSQEYKTYRLSFKEKRALPQGGYQDIASEDNPMRLSELLRMTPKQVRLAPGERQVVKLALRRKRDMAEGEYRSHLFFQALPNGQEQAQPGGGIRLNMIMSYSIPVIYRQSTSLPQVEIEQAQILRSDTGLYDKVAITLKRNGNASSFGNLRVLWRQNQQAQWQQIALTNSYSIYPEVSRAQLQLTILKPQLLKNPRSGQLKVVYDGGSEYAQQQFAERIFTVSSGQ
ncbi:fimbrial biogenesis chaperone [Pseudoalteromonas rubra]|uniref:Molecular chaperone n=1 Tax=Pseudoalteromonas rubra TaxID=43658 RepID=A0A4Q7EBP2_9GAMM|nr:fimbria/pilus periplasmic chaperone [Pseudoalteromonas rubra]RZM80107.1 molecular chaperone [Pseudoalteromonas rubra]